MPFLARAARVVRNGIVRDASTRLLLVPVTGVAQVLLSRLVVSTIGRDGYGLVALVWSTTTLLAFLDFGLGGAVLQKFASASSRDQRTIARLAYRRASRIMMAVCTVSAAIAVALSIYGVPAFLLQVPRSFDWPIVFMLCAYVLALAAGLAQRVLIGTGRNTYTILLNGCVSPLALLIAVIGIRLADPTLVFVGAPALALLITNIAAVVLTVGEWPDSAIEKRAVKVGVGVAMSVLLISIAQPIALQSDRIVINYVRGAADVATYAPIAQLYLALASIQSAAGLGLWTRLAQKRDEPQEWFESTKRAALAMTAVGFALAVLIGTGAWPVVALIGQGRIPFSVLLVVAFGTLLIVQGATTAFAMALTSPSDLRFQAKLLLLMLPVNLAVSILLVRFTVSGPVWSSALTIFGLQLIPLYGRLRKARNITPVQEVVGGT